MLTVLLNTLFVAATLAAGLSLGRSALAFRGAWRQARREWVAAQAGVEVKVTLRASGATMGAATIYRPPFATWAQSAPTPRAPRAVA